MGSGDGCGPGGAVGLTAVAGVLAVRVGHRGRTACAAVGQRVHRRDVLAAKQLAGLNGAIELARIDVADRNAELLQRFAKLARHRAALLTQLPLRGHVVELEGVDVLLAVIGGAVTKHDDVATVLERRYEAAQIGRKTLRRHHEKNDQTRNDGRRLVHGCLR